MGKLFFGDLEDWVSVTLTCSACKEDGVVLSEELLLALAVERISNKPRQKK